ncbi:MAG: RluA family pseudouridine synthase [Planctomycetia bacterium]
MQSKPPVPETLFEDDHLIVLAKPAGLPTANAPRGTTSAFTLVQRGLPRGGFVGVVSRIDAPVSGVLVFAKTRAAAAELSRQFRERTVEKDYVAIVEGRFPAPLGTWVDWHDTITREDRDRPDRDDRDDRDEIGGEPPDEEADSGRAAHARARVVCRAGEVSLVELAPSTGRRHQLRLQLSRRRCPIVGDRRYGSRIPLEQGAIALHARRLAIDHPATGERITIESPLPPAWSLRFPALFKRSDRPPGGGRQGRPARRPSGG